MIESWIQPILDWLGIGLIPLLLILIVIIMIFKE